MSAPPAETKARDHRVWIAVAVAAVVFALPVQAPEGTDPWPLALGIALAGALVAGGGWLILRRSPPAE